VFRTLSSPSDPEGVQNTGSRLFVLVVRTQLSAVVGGPHSGTSYSMETACTRCGTGAVLEKLARMATRVTIPERDLIEVPLQRYLLSDVIK
jgi:hypothetical protein